MANVRKVLVGVIGLALLTGCGADTADTSGGSQGSAQVQWVDLGDGTEVRCVMWWDGYRGGVSCDWDNLRPRS